MLQAAQATRNYSLMFFTITNFWQIVKGMKNGLVLFFTQKRKLSPGTYFLFFKKGV